MENNVTLEQLVEQAKQTADYRMKVMNQLRKHIKSVLIPSVCSVLEAYDMERMFFKSSTKLISEMNKCEVYDLDPTNEKEHCWSINNDGTISHYYLTQVGDSEWEWKESNTKSHITFADCVIKKKYLSEFVLCVKGTLTRLNERMQKQAEMAKRILESEETPK